MYESIVEVLIGILYGPCMVDVKICDLGKTRCNVFKALIDTGATLSVLPRSVAEDLNVNPIRKDVVETGVGLLEISRGVAIFEIMGRETISEIWISDIIDKIIIGTVTLELLGLKLDPKQVNWNRRHYYFTEDKVMNFIALMVSIIRLKCCITYLDR